MQLFEKHRPTRLDDVVGQSKAVESVRRAMTAGVGGRAFWISGPSGSGKTTLARIIARSLADDWFITELDSADDFGADALDLMREGMGLYGGGKGGRAWIINEAHGLRRDIIRKLLGVLERVPGHCVVIFTTTREGQEALFEDYDDASPLLSRCLRVGLTNQGLAKAFAERVAVIADAEGLNGMPKEAYLALAKRCGNNCRSMLCEVEAGAMIGGAA